MPFFPDEFDSKDCTSFVFFRQIRDIYDLLYYSMVSAATKLLNGTLKDHKKTVTEGSVWRDEDVMEIITNCSGNQTDHRTRARWSDSLAHYFNSCSLCFIWMKCICQHGIPLTSEWFILFTKCLNKKWNRTSLLAPEAKFQSFLQTMVQFDSNLEWLDVLRDSYKNKNLKKLILKAHKEKVFFLLSYDQE